MLQFALARPAQSLDTAFEVLRFGDELRTGTGTSPEWRKSLGIWNVPAHIPRLFTFALSSALAHVSAKPRPEGSWFDFCG